MILSDFYVLSQRQKQAIQKQAIAKLAWTLLLNTNASFAQDMYYSSSVPTIFTLLYFAHTDAGFAQDMYYSSSNDIHPPLFRPMIYPPAITRYLHNVFSCLCPPAVLPYDGGGSSDGSGDGRNANNNNAPMSITCNQDANDNNTPPSNTCNQAINSRQQPTRTCKSRGPDSTAPTAADLVTEYLNNGPRPNPPAAAKKVATKGKKGISAVTLLAEYL